METQTLSDDKNFLTHFLLPGRRSALLIRLEPSRLHIMEYDFAAKKSVTRLSLPEEAFAGFTISDDKHWLAVTSYEQKAILLYDLSGGTMRFSRRIPVDGIDNARFLNGGQWIAAGTNDKTMRLWETKTGASIGVLRGHTDNPKYPSLSPDGRTIATCGTELERSVRLWDTRRMQEIAVFRLPERVKAARFTQDGSALLVMDVKNVLTVFRAGASKTAPTESRSRVAHQ